MTLQEIPLFPLNVVLFPTAKIPLRIFEDRYKQLFEDTLKGGGPFGIVLIKDGSEVGGSAEPFDVGTLAEIEAVDYRKDSIFVLCRGSKRFRIHELLNDRPYLVGKVEVLTSEPAPSEEDLERLAQLRSTFDDYLERMRRVAKALGGELQASSLPADVSPRETAYAIASTVALDVAQKQVLLETDGFGDFLTTLQSLIQREIEFMRPDENAPDPSTV